MDILPLSIKQLTKFFYEKERRSLSPIDVLEGIWYLFRYIVVYVIESLIQTKNHLFAICFLCLWHHS